MPRRDLRGAAWGVLSSFVSRNNDVDGYWGIGELYAHALRNTVESVEIDLLSKRIVPHADEFTGMISHYAEMLLQQCQDKRIPIPWIGEAKIHVQFNISPQGRCCPPQSTRGDLFECLLEIKDSLGRGYAAHMVGWCAPHDPQQEMRSARPRNSVTS
jgi:hypothetical protein